MSREKVTLLNESLVGNNKLSTVSPSLKEASNSFIFPGSSTDNVKYILIESSSNSDKPFFSEITPYLSVVGVCLVIVGWLVVYQNAKRLATRNETKSLIDDVVSIISKLESLATDYWLSGRRNRVDTEEYILLTSAKLEMLNGRLIIINNRGISIETIDLANIADLMTLNCEDIDRRKAESNREQVQLLLEEFNSGVSGLYISFEKYYTPSKTRSIKRTYNKCKKCFMGSFN